jgi:CRP-like cAMP-binding protein
MLEPGEFFGEGCIVSQPLRMASASATERATVVRIEKAVMIRVLHEQPEIADRFTAFLLARNIQIEADLVDQLFNSSELRLARLLLLLANFGKEKWKRFFRVSARKFLQRALVRRARGSISS